MCGVFFRGLFRLKKLGLYRTENESIHSYWSKVMGKRGLFNKEEALSQMKKDGMMVKELPRGGNG